MNNKILPIKKNYIPSSATVTLTATDFNDLIKKVEEAALIKEQLLARYTFILEKQDWDDRPSLYSIVHALPIQEQIGQEVAKTLAADPGIMAHLAALDRCYFDFSDGEIRDYGFGDEHKFDLMTVPEFTYAWNQAMLKAKEAAEAEVEDDGTI